MLRPANDHSESILRLLAGLEEHGFRGAPSPVGLDPDGRERLRCIPGDIAIPPYPDRTAVLRSLDEAIAHGGAFVRRHVESGEPGLVTMWAEMGGQERFDRHRRWWADARGRRRLSSQRSMVR